MSQNYTIKDVRKGQTSKDSYGEYQSYALALAEFGQPVKLTRAVDGKIPEVGDTIYGDLVEFEANEKTYYKFSPAQKPVQAPMTTQEAIMSQWAIGQAVQCYLAGEPSVEAYNNIEAEAKHFYEMINNIRGDN